MYAAGRGKNMKEEKTLNTRGWSFGVSLNKRDGLTGTPHGTLTLTYIRTDKTLFTDILQRYCKRKRSRAPVFTGILYDQIRDRFSIPLVLSVFASDP